MPVILVQPKLGAGDLQSSIEDPRQPIGVNEEPGSLAQQDRTVDHVCLQSEKERVPQHHVQRDVPREEIDSHSDVVTGKPKQAEIVQVWLEQSHAQAAREEHGCPISRRVRLTGRPRSGLATRNPHR